MAFNKGRVKTGGRQAGTPNKVSAKVRDLAGQHVDDMIEEIYNLAINKTTPAHVRFSCAKELIYLASGRPQPMPENPPPEVNDPLDELSNAELEQRAEEEIERYQDLKLHQ